VVSLTSRLRIGAARMGAAALSAPLLLGGFPAVAAHGMLPSVGVVVNYQSAAAAQDPDGARHFGCQFRSMCYGPDQIRAAYDIQPVLDSGITGAGQTIVLIEAYASPTVQADLLAFDSNWGMQAPASFQVLAPEGVPDFDPTNQLHVMWSSETSLDVQWAHAIAPGAAIVVVQAKSHLDTDMLSVTQWAIDRNLGDVISQSFGEAEMCADPELIAQEHAAFAAATAKGITLIASSGDQGAAQPDCTGSSLVLSASTPASDPLVTAIGGTHLNADFTSGAYSSETAWSGGGGAGGGGFSDLFRRPGYQAPFQADNKHRGVPDVAYNGDLQVGVMAAWNVPCLYHLIKCPPIPGFYPFFVFGGTSAGAPQWAGIVALGNELGGHRLGSINKDLYHIARSKDAASALRDVTAGTIAFPGFPGFAAGDGWDAATGLGTPRVSALLPLLI